MENPIKIHDLGGPPLFLETPKSMDLKYLIDQITWINLTNLDLPCGGAEWMMDKGCRSIYTSFP